MGLFSHFPYTNIHQLNLDWIIEQLKTLEDNAVLSVNGQTGHVELYQSENVVFPSVESGTWRMVRTAAGNVAGVMFQNGLMYVMAGDTADRVYTINHPPAYPVTSVDGQTGAVQVFPNAATRLPDTTENYTNIRRQIKTNGVDNIVGIELKDNDAYRMKDNNRYKIYDEGNTPNIVTSINGESGAIMIAIPFEDVETDNIMFSDAASGHAWSLGRETADGTASIQLETSASGADVYLRFFTEDDPPVSYVRKLLTIDDIPSSSGVVSINGQSGVVTLTGNQIGRTSSNPQTVENALQHLETEEQIDESAIAILVNGDTAAYAVLPGEFVFIINNTHGLTDGLYRNTSVSTFPVSGGVADSTVFTAVPKGGLNALGDKIEIACTLTSNDSRFIPGTSSVTVYRTSDMLEVRVESRWDFSGTNFDIGDNVNMEISGLPVPTTTVTAVGTHSSRLMVAFLSGTTVQVRNMTAINNSANAPLQFTFVYMT